VRVGGTNEFSTYADPNTIRRKGELVKIWVLYDHKTVQTMAGESHLSIRTQEQFDCAEELSRTLSTSWFTGNMLNGELIDIDDGDQKWRAVPPVTVIKALWTFACSKQ